GGWHRPGADHSHLCRCRARAFPHRGVRALLPPQRSGRAGLPAGKPRAHRSLREPALVRGRIAMLSGDGIGPEVAAEALRCLRAIARRFDHELTITELPFGGAAIDACGDPLPEQTLRGCREADAILLGAIGGPRWSAPGAQVRPEQGLLRLRKELGVYANLRPVAVQTALIEVSTLKPQVLEGVDLVFVRELTGGIYFGDKARDAAGARDVCTYTVGEVERIVRVAGRLARQRRRKVTSIEKS